MVLDENLNKSNIILKPKSTNRWELIREMVEIAVKNKKIQEEDKEEIIKALIEREKSMTTGIGNGVAIPHCTSQKVNDITVIMAISKNGIAFDSVDNQAAHIVILLLVPKNKLAQHIKTLANIAKMMGDKILRESLLALKSAEAVANTIKNYKISG
jgi:fructose-specific phosphotransferase system IIA component